MEKKMLRDFLNEFELDWAQAPVRSELIPAGKIKGKKVLLVGGQEAFIRAVAWSFAAWNDSCRAGVCVESVCPADTEKSDPVRKQMTGIRAGVSVAGETVGGEGEENTVPVKTKLEVNQVYTGEIFAPEEADFIILTGYCCREIPGTVSGTICELQNFAKTLDAVMSISCARVLLLSDGRVYGKLDHAFAASEYEAGRTDPCAAGYEDQYFVQALEGLFLSAARAAGRPYEILRTGRIYGAYLEMMEHSVYTLAQMTAGEQESRLRLSAERSSYVSIHDVLTAIQFVLTKCPENKIFNVSGPESDASDSEIAMMLYRNFPEQCKVTMEWCAPGQDTGILLNTQLIRRYGFVPQVTLEDGLIIQVKSLQNTEGIFIFDNTYMGKLTRVQQILLGYLLEIDRICKKHGIKYFLAGGTLLGAIRHHGFIPWDDDADVMMLREDFDRFMEVVQQELPDNIFVQIPSTEKGNHNPFTKLRINNTMFATEFTGRFLDMHNGIFFDVLSHDRTGKHKWSRKLHLMWTMLSRSIVFNKWGNTNIKSGGSHPLFCKFVDKAKYLIPMPFAEWMQERALRFFQNRKTDYLYDGMGRNLKRGSFPKAWLDEAVYVDFEGYRFPVPKEYDKYLTWLYGDYMQMIPVSQRRTSHSIVLMDLGEYSGYKCGE